MLLFDYKKMQSANKNKEVRNNRLASIRANLKIVPILHSTTDRVNKMIADDKGAQKFIQKSSTDSISLNESHVQRKSKSQNQKAFQAKFRLGKKIGQGAHGYVKQCYHKETGKMFALKVIPSDHEYYYYLKRNFVNIIGLDHPNIIKYKAFFFDMLKQTCLLVMDYMPYPSLSEIQIQSQEELKRIIYEVIEGLDYIHRKHICHRDIKPQNILFDKQSKKSILIDFGVSCKFHQRGINKEMLTVTGTPLYRAPEMFSGGGYDERVDLWALGVLIFKLVEKVTPFEALYHSDTINNIIKGEFTFNPSKWSNYSHLVKDLVSHLLKPKQSRLTIEQAKNHFWFENIRGELDEEMIKSAGFNGFFTLKRTATECRNSSSIRSKHPTLSPKMTFLSSPKMFNLQKYQEQENHMRWISLDGNNEMDLIQSEDEDSSPSPRLKYKK